MNLYDLKDRGYNIATNWQECNTKSIFILITNDIKKFLNYISLASKKKCKYIICDIKFKKNIKQKQIKFFFYKKQNDLFEIAKIFYSLNNLKIVFVTGTNGKTSIAYGANKLFNINGNKSCYIGTLGFYINSKKIKKLKNTTPSYFEILNLLKIAINNKVKFVFIEVSSIGYSEGRIGNLKFDYCILTNLKSDHLDYHKNLRSYHLAKVNIIKNHISKNSILFFQDDYLKNKFKNYNQIFTQSNFLSKNKISIVHKRTGKFIISTKNRSYQIDTFNDYMIKNIITIFMVYKKIFKQLPLKMNKSVFPPGRSEVVFNKKNKIIIVDYAHSKDAYENLLCKLPFLDMNIIIIYGCGGDRDKIKRPQIAKVVSKYTNLQIITDDNPRNEDPASIRKSLMKYSSNPIEVPSRRKAIKFGISYIKKNDGILIIAGKGHEDTQNYRDKHYLFNDRLISSKYAKNL